MGRVGRFILVVGLVVACCVSAFPLATPIVNAADAPGTVKWSFVTGGRIESSPAIGADGTLYAGSDDGNLYALNSDGLLT
jgi:outer membrane protein assembly factor BamB